jgi:hypothetical protein
MTDQQNEDDVHTYQNWLTPIVDHPKTNYEHKPLINGHLEI